MSCCQCGDEEDVFPQKIQRVVFLDEATLEHQSKRVAKPYQNWFNKIRNTCFRSCVDRSFGLFLWVKDIPPPPPRFHESLPLLIGGIALSVFLQMEDSEEEEQEEKASEEFNLISPYSEKDSNTESGARGSQRGKASQAVLTLPLLLLPTLILGRECWNRWGSDLIVSLHFLIATAVESISALAREPQRTATQKKCTCSYNVCLSSLITLLF